MTQPTEIIFHIGMGKTGTSSIQAALSQCSDYLRGYGIEYLGMWFDSIHPEFFGLSGMQKFLSNSPEDMESLAEEFLRKIRLRENKIGANRFILSNEDIFGNREKISPFIVALSRSSKVSIIAYARDPRAWLPSAYNQWGIFHKYKPGPVPSYHEFARSHIGIYSAVLLWADTFSGQFSLRPLDESADVLRDFFHSSLNVPYNKPKTRALQRPEISENLLRSVYNNRFEECALPDRFDQAIGKSNVQNTPELEYIISRNFDYSTTDELVSERKELFLEIKHRLGVDLLRGRPPEHNTPDIEYIRNRVIDHLLATTMDQADRISRLERILSNTKVVD